MIPHRIDAKKIVLVCSIIFLIAVGCFIGFVLSSATLDRGGLQPVNSEMSALLQEQTAGTTSPVSPSAIPVEQKQNLDKQTSATETSVKSDSMINLNTASVEQLMELPGIGEVKAKAIIEYREQNGKFSTTEQITEVKGIGAKTYVKLKDKITVQ